MQQIELDEFGIEVVHHFSDGVYSKEIHVPAGVEIKQHKHKFEHMSILAKGTARVEKDGATEYFIGPAVVIIAAGVAHKVYAMTDIVWFCTHATDEKDPDNIDHTLIEEN
jgi:quercetin dioxygenase-like cupin family protein